MNEIPFLRDESLKQIAGNINQVYWLRELNPGQILYVSPAFKTVWEGSCESFYADSAILIVSAHPEDRVQVLVASSHDGHKPIDQAYAVVQKTKSTTIYFKIRNQPYILY